MYAAVVVLDRAALRASREKAGLSEAELGRRSGVAQSHISALEIGLANAGPATVKALSRALGVPLVDLLHESVQGDDGFADSQSVGINAAALITLRELAGLSQRELCRRSGVSQGYVSQLERGERTAPCWRTVRRLADALRVPAEALICGVAGDPPGRESPRSSLSALLGARVDVLVTWVEELQAADLRADPARWIGAELLYEHLGAVLAAANEPDTGSDHPARRSDAGVQDTIFDGLVDPAEVTDQLRDELCSLCRDLASVVDPAAGDHWQRWIDRRARRIAWCAFFSPHRRQAQGAVASLMAVLWPHGAPEAVGRADWWRTPLGHACARTLSRADTAEVTHSVAAAMLGVTRGTIAQLIARGTLDRHPNGGVRRASVLKRIATRTTPFRNHPYRQAQPSRRTREKETV